MSKVQKREFALSWIQSYKNGEFSGTTDLIIENPTPNDLDNNVVHVISADYHEQEIKNLREIAQMWKDESIDKSEKIGALKAEIAKRDAAIKVMREGLSKANSALKNVENLSIRMPELRGFHPFTEELCEADKILGEK